MIDNKELLINYSSQAVKFLSKHQDIKLKFEDNIKKMINGIRVDVTELEGFKKIYRMRVGKYRVIYSIIHSKITIINVLEVGSRGDVYKHL